MKRLLQYVFVLIVIGTSVYSIYQKTLSPCDRPLEYSIGRFDSQFGVSQTDFKSYIVEAGAVWEKILKRKMFIYNSNADFKINLIYDQRQLATNQKQKTEFGLSSAEETFKTIDAEFNLFKNQYDQRVASYEQKLALFKKATSQHGMRSDVTNIEIENLNKEAFELNQMTQQLNTLLKERNIKASEYNKIVEEYNKKYNNGLEFNQAEYTGKEINVYQFGNKKDLILALTHELGHALGMDHVAGPKSIMYYITGVNTETSLMPSVDDLAELSRVCK